MPLHGTISASQRKPSPCYRRPVDPPTRHTRMNPSTLAHTRSVPGTDRRVETWHGLPFTGAVLVPWMPAQRPSSAPGRTASAYPPKAHVRVLERKEGLRPYPPPTATCATLPWRNRLGPPIWTRHTLREDAGFAASPAS